jgi:type I restriction enzyme S subunit
VSKSWPLVPLEEIFAIARGGSPRPIDSYLTDDPRGVNWVMISDATESGKYISSTKKRIRPEGAQRSRYVKPGDFLLTNSMSFGRPYIMNTTGCIHDGWLVLSPRDGKASPDFFYHLLGSDFVYSEFARLAAGATVKNLNIDLVKRVKVPLPPLAEQRRIAEILDRAEALRAKRRASLTQLDTLTQSIFLELFGDPVTNSKGWPLRRIRDLLESASYGTSARAESAGAFAVLRMNNITRNGGMDLTDLKFMDLSAKDRDSYTVRSGDVLFNRTNSAELVGKTGIYRGNDPMAYAGYLVRLRTNKENDPEYLWGFLNSRYAKRILRGMCKSIIGMANINATEVQAIKIPQPPIALQRQFADRVANVESMKVTGRRSLSVMNSLLSALQSRAFRGEL